MKSGNGCSQTNPRPIDAIFGMDKVSEIQHCRYNKLKVFVPSSLGVSMSRVVVLAVICALFLGPFGLGAVAAWAHHDGNAMSHQGDDKDTNGHHQSHDGIVACGPAACAPAVASSGHQYGTNSQIVEQLFWGFLDDRALYSALSKQDPPVPRFGA
jgi:hypothetical protein